MTTMRLWGVSMVRNEADVIEAFVRHNLGVLDGLAIVDHGSFDGTAQILAELQREGLSLRIVRDEPRSSIVANYAYREETAARPGATMCSPSMPTSSCACRGERLERALLDVPPEMHAVAHC
jgi:hypothetical protein